ncbi:MAG: reverse transcriptase domain-containing protein [Patescibacteria group bacterium]|jgi:retron-type reverse transcriptase
MVKSFDELISLKNIFSCWRDFRRDKAKKPDVMEFERCLEDNIFKLHNELSSDCYRHGPYSTFHIYDPKHRVISKALVRDRLVHHVVFNELYRIFDPSFIYHSYSSRVAKGTHLAVLNLFHCLRQVSHNYTQTVYILKCDIKKFFWSVDHQKLLAIIQNKIKDEKFLWLINEIIGSFLSTKIAKGGGFKGFAYR